jgi:O-antigen ligase
VIICLIPLVFIFWRPKRGGQNFVRVVLPVLVLLFGIYLTHSRGALLALTAVVVVASRRRIGTMPALLIAGVIFAAAMALNFTGGRDISAESGADRTALWSSGLQMLKANPFFGVGLGGFIDNCDGCGHTAHNSVVVCAAELGLVGFYFWCLFLFPTVRDALAVASLAKASEKQLIEAEPIQSPKTPFPQRSVKIEEIDNAEVKRLGSLVVTSLAGFLVAGWFLSRAYVPTFFLLGGIAEVVFQMALQRGLVAPRLRMARLLPYTAGLELSLLLLMYINLRAANLMH